MTRDLRDLLRPDARLVSGLVVNVIDTALAADVCWRRIRLHFVPSRVVSRIAATPRKVPMATFDLECTRIARMSQVFQSY
jgi:hypothetical protein